ncbi:MAG: hypothetical protein KDJ22_05715 [Candidatus Competibacteraceae bacterium]|nr:hypothetical protein [Candidatus Competibacteraceae bacterium]MCP5124144.1 hypothetical protein [Gammaproteobacteria bacterium]
MPMIGQPVAARAGRDASRCGGSAGDLHGSPRRPPCGRGTRSQPYQLYCQRNRQEPLFNDTLTFGSGGPATAPIATRHARSPETAEQENPK